MTKQEFTQLPKQDQINYLIENTDLGLWMTLSNDDQWFVNDRRKEIALEKREARKAAMTVSLLNN
jgi:hypothetical protein